MTPPKDDEHGPTRTIYINTVAVETRDRDLTFQEIVELAYPGHATDPSSYVISYGRKNATGMETLMLGQSVKPKEGMVFDAYLANRS